MPGDSRDFFWRRAILANLCRSCSVRRRRPLRYLRHSRPASGKLAAVRLGVLSCASLPKIGTDLPKRERASYLGILIDLDTGAGARA